MHSNNLLFLAILMLPLTLTAQVASVSGKVVVHNSSYSNGLTEFIKNAYITTDYGGATQTDRKGHFELMIGGLEEGQTVRITVQKEGYSVVNKKVLEKVVIGENQFLEIWMMEGNLTNQLSKLNQTCAELAKDHIHKLLFQLQKEDPLTGVNFQELQIQLGQSLKHHFEVESALNKQYLALQKALPSINESLVQVNLDYASGNFQKAFEWYQEGKIELVIQFLENLPLEDLSSGLLKNIQDQKKQSSKDIQTSSNQLDQIIQTYQLKAICHRLLFQIKEAALTYEKMVEVLDQVSPNKNWPLAAAYQNAVEMYLALKDFKKALVLQEKNIAALSTNDSLKSNYYNTLAQIFINLDQPEKAIEVALKSVDIQLNAFGPNHPGLLQTYQDLGLCYHQLGNKKNALIYFQKAYNVLKILPSSQHSEKLAFVKDLAAKYFQIKEYHTALNLILEVTSQKDLQSTTNDLNLAQSYSLLSSIYQELGKYQEASEAISNSIAIQGKVLAPNHPAIAESYSNMAQLHRNYGLYSEALDAQQKAIAIQKLAFSYESIEMAESYNLLADIFQHLKWYESALKAQLKTVSIADNMGIANQSLGGIYYMNLSKLYFFLNDLNLAIENGEKAQQIFDNAFFPDQTELSMNLAIYYKNRGIQAQQLGEIQLAINDYERAIKYGMEDEDLVSQLNALKYNDPYSHSNGEISAELLAVKTYYSKTSAEKKTIPEPEKMPAIAPLPIDFESIDYQIKALLKSRQFKKAQQLSIESLGKNPDHDIYRVYLVLSYACLGNLEKARQMWFVFHRRVLPDKLTFSEKILKEIELLTVEGLWSNDLMRLKAIIEH